MSRADAPQVTVSALLATLAATLLGYILQRTQGHYLASAIGGLVAAWVMTLAALFCRSRIRVHLPLIVGVGITCQLALLATAAPTIEMPALRNASDLQAFSMAIVVVAVLVGSTLSTRSALPRLWFPLAVALHFILGLLVLKWAPHPRIDVFAVEMEAAEALLQGINPFAITISNPYGDSSPLFPSGVSVNGSLQFGFVYPPLLLLLCLPGYLLGDPRLSMLAAMSLSALFIGYLRPGVLPKLAAMLFLFTPRTYFVLDRAWTDPFVVLVVAAVAFVAVHWPKWVWLPAGLYLAAKQQMFIGIPALFLLVPRPLRFKELIILGLKAGAVGLSITLPFVFWNPKAFINSVLNIREVFRTDSLGLLAHFANQNIAHLSKWTGLAAILPIMLLGAWKAPRNVGGFALLTAATHFTLYLFSTHAFCNEYYNVIGSLCVALAAFAYRQPLNLANRHPLTA